jgi:hypothetical protein
MLHCNKIFEYNENTKVTQWKIIKLTASASRSLELFLDRRFPKLMKTFRWFGAMRVV